MKFRRPALIASTMLLLTIVGCSKTGNALETQRPTLEISHMVQSIGAVEGKEDTHDFQRFSYTLALANNDNEQIYVKEVQVTLPAEFEQRVTTKNFIIQVNTAIQPKSYIEIENSHEFDAKGLSKEDISNKLSPHITSIKVLSESTISLEGRFN